MEITEIENNTTNKNVNSRLTTDNVTHQSSPVTRHPSPTYSDDEVDLIEYIKIIWKYKWFIILVTVFAVIGTYFYTKSLPKIYSSTVSVIIPQEEGGGSGLSAVLGGMGFGDLVGGNSSGDLIVDVLRSRRIAEQVSKHWDLIMHYNGDITSKKIAKTIKNKGINLENLYVELKRKGYIDQYGKVIKRFDLSQEKVILSLNKQDKPTTEKLAQLFKNEHQITKEIMAVNKLTINTKVEASKSGLIKITVEDESPTMAANIANYYIVAIDIMNEELQISTKKPMLKVLDKAIIPSWKSKPRMLVNLAITGISSLFISIFLSFFIDYIFAVVKLNRK